VSAEDGVPYQRGGHLAPEVTRAENRTGKPEQVVPMCHWADVAADLLDPPGGCNSSEGRRRWLWQRWRAYRSKI
jgi:hypothetical protein